MRLIDADRLLDRCIFYHLPNGDLAVPIIDVQHAPTVEAPDINVGNMDTTTHDSIPVETGKNDGDRTTDDLISRQAMLDGIDNLIKIHFDRTVVLYKARQVAENLPSIQPKQNEMIKEIRRWINSGNRGNADYFIVDKIEEIINAYE